MTCKKRWKNGCWSPDFEKLKETDTCPFICSHISGGSGCARWGSGTPTVHLLRDCTVKDLKNCPLTEYPNETSILFWNYWLEVSGLIRRREII